MSSNLVKFSYIQIFTFSSLILVGGKAFSETPKDIIVNTSTENSTSIRTDSIIIREGKRVLDSNSSTQKDLSYEVNACETLKGKIKNTLLDENTNNVFLVEIIRAAKNGTIDLNKNGDFTYIPKLTSQENDSFSYSITDKNSIPTIGEVKIKINPRSNVSLGTPSSNNPLVVNNSEMWKSGLEKSQPYAFKFLRDGRMYIIYNSYSGDLITKKATYEIGNTFSKQCPNAINIIFDGKRLQTIFEVSSNNNREKILRIELVGVRFDEDRPTFLTKQVREFNIRRGDE